MTAWNRMMLMGMLVMVLDVGSGKTLT